MYVFSVIICCEALGHANDKESSFSAQYINISNTVSHRWESFLHHPTILSAIPTHGSLLFPSVATRDFKTVSLSHLRFPHVRRFLLLLLLLNPFISDGSAEWRGGRGRDSTTVFQKKHPTSVQVYMILTRLLNKSFFCLANPAPSDWSQGRKRWRRKRSFSSRWQNSSIKLAEERLGRKNCKSKQCQDQHFPSRKVNKNAKVARDDADPLSS